MSRSVRAWLSSSAAALADSSALAATSWVTTFICSTSASISVTTVAWCSTAAEISAVTAATRCTSLSICSSERITSPLSCTPFSALSTLRSIRAAVFLAASAERMASARTSSATTAKPRPASPARADSTAAFSASRFVWKAISSMVFTIFAVSALACRMSWTAPVSRFIRDVPSLVCSRELAARARASAALAAL